MGDIKISFRRNTLKRPQSLEIASEKNNDIFTPSFQQTIQTQKSYLKKGGIVLVEDNAHIQS